MRLLVNADDFGMSRGVNHGIIDAFLLGIVRSTTLMATGSAYTHAVELSRRYPELGVGVHLTLTTGRPLRDGLSTLTDAKGDFLRPPELEKKLSQVDPDQVEREFTAQIERVLSDGIQPTHLDSHHHTHLLAPVFPVFLHLADYYGLPVRLPTGMRLPSEYADIPHPDVFVDSFLGQGASVRHLEKILDDHRDAEVVEVMCHPAHLDRYLLDHSSYNLPRVDELAVLAGGDTRSLMERRRVRLTDYRVFHPAEEEGEMA